MPVEGEVVVCASICTVRVTLAEGDGCVRTDGVCASGTLCNASGVCARPLPIGASCALGDDCVRGAYCDASESAPGACREVVLLGEGEPCGPGATSLGTFPYCDMSKDLVCDAVTSRCVRTTVVGLGETCSAVARCAEGLYCASGTCAPVLGTGESCLADYECASGRCVFGPSSATCGDPLPYCR